MLNLFGCCIISKHFILCFIVVQVVVLYDLVRCYNMENKYIGNGLCLIRPDAIMLYYCKQCLCWFLLRFEVVISYSRKGFFFFLKINRRITLASIFLVIFADQ